MLYSAIQRVLPIERFPSRRQGFARLTIALPSDERIILHYS